MQIAIVTIGPILYIFSVHALGMTEWVIIVGLSLQPLPINEGIKLLKK